MTYAMDSGCGVRQRPPRSRFGRAPRSASAVAAIHQHGRGRKGGQARRAGVEHDGRAGCPPARTRCAPSGYSGSRGRTRRPASARPAGRRPSPASGPGTRPPATPAAPPSRASWRASAARARVQLARTSATRCRQTTAAHPASAPRCAAHLHVQGPRAGSRGGMRRLRVPRGHGGALRVRHGVQRRERSVRVRQRRSSRRT